MHKVCLHAATYSFLVSYLTSSLLGVSSTPFGKHQYVNISRKWYHCREQLTIIEFLLGELSKLVNPRHIVLVTIVV